MVITRKSHFFSRVTFEIRIRFVLP